MYPRLRGLKEKHSHKHSTHMVIGRPRGLLAACQRLHTAATRKQEASPLTRKPRKRRTKTEANVFNNPLSEIAYHQFYHALLVTWTNSSPRQEGILYKDVNTWRQESCWRLAVTPCSSKRFQQRKPLHDSRMWSRGLKWSWVGYFLVCKSHQGSISMIAKCKWNHK